MLIVMLFNTGLHTGRGVVHQLLQLLQPRGKHRQVGTGAMQSRGIEWDHRQATPQRTGCSTCWGRVSLHRRVGRLGRAPGSCRFCRRSARRSLGGCLWSSRHHPGRPLGRLSPVGHFCLDPVLRPSARCGRRWQRGRFPRCFGNRGAGLCGCSGTGKLWLRTRAWWGWAAQCRPCSACNHGLLRKLAQAVMIIRTACRPVRILCKYSHY